MRQRRLVPWISRSMWVALAVWLGVGGSAWAQGILITNLDAVDTSAYPTMRALVTVTDENGIPVRGLDAQAFELNDDGRGTFAPDKVEVVPNGLDLDAIRLPGAGPEASAPRPAPREDFVFAHVGQFAPWKNHEIFLRAAEQVARDLPRAQFVIVGDDLFGRNSLYKRTLYYSARYCAAALRTSRSLSEIARIRGGTAVSPQVRARSQFWMATK